MTSLRNNLIVEIIDAMIEDLNRRCGLSIKDLEKEIRMAWFDIVRDKLK